MFDCVLNTPLWFEILLWNRAIVLKVNYFLASGVFSVSHSRLSSKISSNIVFQQTLFRLPNNIKTVVVVSFFQHHPAGRFLFKVTNGNNRTTWKICSELTLKTGERHQWCRSAVVVFNFEQISHIVLVFQLLTLNKQMPNLPFSKLYTC